MPNASIRFGALLRHFRTQRGITQLEFGALAGVSARHLSFMETGRSNPSAAMIDRLGSALGLASPMIDDLREAAGFARRDPGLRVGLGERVFASAIAIERATRLSEVVGVGREILPELGVTHFFFGRMGNGPRSGFDWADAGAFPANWLRAYDRERYAATDPLLAVVRAGRDCFFWDEVIDRRALTRPARAMFDAVAARGLSAGFVTASRRRQSTALISMMGQTLDRRDDGIRLGLEVLGSRMLSAFERLS